MNLKQFKPSVRKRLEKAFVAKYGRLPVKAKASKYRNQKTSVDDIVFDSKKEALRWKSLQLLARVGSVKDLKRQVSFELIVNRKKICVYKADFTYRENGNFVVEDVKGVKTDVYKLKKKLMFAIYGVTIKET